MRKNTLRKTTSSKLKIRAFKKQDKNFAVIFRLCFKVKSKALYRRASFPGQVS